MHLRGGISLYPLFEYTVYLGKFIRCFSSFHVMYENALIHRKLHRQMDRL